MGKLIFISVFIFANLLWADSPKNLLSGEPRSPISSMLKVGEWIYFTGYHYSDKLSEYAGTLDRVRASGEGEVERIAYIWNTYSAWNLQEHQGHIYWSVWCPLKNLKLSGIYRLDPNKGGPPEKVIDTQIAHYTIDGDYIYWIEGTVRYGSGTLNRFDLKTGEAKVLYKSSVHFSPYSITTDNNFVYFSQMGKREKTDDLLGKIIRVSKQDGSATILVDKLIDVYDLTAQGGHLYWVYSRNDGGKTDFMRLSTTDPKAFPEVVMSGTIIGIQTRVIDGKFYLASWPNLSKWHADILQFDPLSGKIATVLSGEAAAAASDFILDEKTLYWGTASAPSYLYKSSF